MVMEHLQELEFHQANVRKLSIVLKEKIKGWADDDKVNMKNRKLRLFDCMRISIYNSSRL